MPLIEAIPPVRGRRGRPRRRPQAVFGDRGYDHDKYRDLVDAKGILPVIARRGTPHGSGLDVYRWVVEEPSRGCTSTSGYAPAGNAEPTFTKPGSASPAS
jgi:hypothetical protein